MTTDFWLGFGSGATAVFAIFALAVVAWAFQRRRLP